MILLTDGRVMVQEEGTTHWHALSPAANGSYLNGTWAPLADMSIWRRYNASAVLKDGRVFVCGGEQSGAGDDTNMGEIYDPVADKWTAITTPPWSQVGDATCCVLPDGRVMIGALTSTACIIYNPVTDSWTTAASKAIRSNEETWILLPDNTILTAQCFSPFQSEKYIIASDTWQNEGSLPVTVVDPVMNEIGPAMLLYNGKTIYLGAANSSGHGKTAIYSRPALPTGTGTWAAGPNIPTVGGQVIICNDCPASLLPNGKVLFSAANFVDNSQTPQANWTWGSPVLFFEYDPAANTITQVPTPPNNSAQLYLSRMMLLPTGQVLFSPSSNNIQCYTPDGGPQEAWRPTVTSVEAHNTPFPAHLDYFLLQGTQLNGLSQANIYGDDCYPATNYPLVQLTDTTTPKVYYARTYAFSTLGVATGTTTQSARFTVSGIPDGTYDLRVIANGISSHALRFSFHRPQKSFLFDVGLKREVEILGKIIYEGDPFTRRDWGVDPEMEALKTQVKSLQNSVQRLTSLIQARELPAVGRDIAQQASAQETKLRNRPAAQDPGTGEQ